jgi:hypothetical protein
MKRIIICAIMLVLATNLFSQQTNHTQPYTKQDYLQKSKHKRNTALVLVGGGVILEAAGIIAYPYGNASFILFGAGFLSQVASVPFFISAWVNKSKSRKASLGFRYERNPGIQPALISLRSSAGISLKIDL